MAQARRDQPKPVSLDVEAQLAATTPPQTDQPDTVRFEGVAVSPGTYVAEDGIEIEITSEHLGAIAARLADVQIRDLHEERVRATVGAVRSARVQDGAVAFEGEIGIEPHATIVRRFPETVAFSVGFRFAREDLDLDAEDTAPLPADFTIDHLAIVGQGQDPDARLTRLLNRARKTNRTGDEITVDEDTAAELRRQRDDALEAKEQAMADLADARARLETKDEQLDAAEQATHEAETNAEQARTDAEAAQLELERAKAGFATSIMKLELKAGEDLDLHRRQQELLEMELSDLDELRLELAEQAAEKADNEDEGPASKPTNETTAPDGPDPAAMDLEDLSMEDTLRLGLVKGVL